MADQVVPLLIDGKDVTTSTTFPVKNPATGQLLHSCSSAGAAEAEAAVTAATAALPAWKKMPPSRRRDLFLKAADVMDKRKDELSQYLMQETAGSPQWADFNLMVAADMLRDVAGRISALCGAIPQTAEAGTSALVVKEPFGVVLAIAPW